MVVASVSRHQVLSVKFAGFGVVPAQLDQWKRMLAVSCSPLCSWLEDHVIVGELHDRITAEAVHMALRVANVNVQLREVVATLNKSYPERAAKIGRAATAWSYEGLTIA